MIAWDSVVHAHAAGEVGRLRAGRRLAISADRAWRAVVDASAPFRLGTRFRAVPDVRLYAGDALIASPGDRLPGPDDRSLDGYIARITGPGGALAGSGGFQLVVTDPLVLDFALWAEVRDLVRGLLARIGVPVLPVVCELVVGAFARTPRGFTRRMHCVVVTAVLAGRLRTRIWNRLWQRSPSEIRDADAHRPDQIVTARAGDLVYWPADRWHLDDAIAPCLALRLWIPAAGGDAGAEVAQVVGELAGLDGDRGAVPFLPFSQRGPGAVPPALRSAGRRVAELARSPELARALAIRWARRVSACGLEPVPAARAIALSGAARVRRDPATPIVRMRWRDEAIWAANGHGFTLHSGERALHRIVRSLDRPGATVAALCGDDPGLRAALAVLAEARAITVAGTLAEATIEDSPR
jgi:hypothetical protein